MRYRRDVGASHRRLVLSTQGREGDEYHNRVTGIDGFFRPRETDTLLVHYVHSDTLYPDEVAEEFGQPMGAFDDDFWEIRYETTTRNWNFAVDYEDYGENFRADSGFVPRVDMLRAQAVGQASLLGRRRHLVRPVGHRHLPQPHRGPGGPAHRPGHPALHFRSSAHCNRCSTWP